MRKLDATAKAKLANARNALELAKKLKSKDTKTLAVAVVGAEKHAASVHAALKMTTDAIKTKLANTKSPSEAAALSKALNEKEVETAGKATTPKL